MTTRTNDNAYQAIFNAAQVISMDHKIASYLGENDPNALSQLRGAITAVQDEIDTSTALSALAERFDSITEITFVAPAQEHALLRLVERAAGTLSMRGRSRLSQKVGADVVRLLSQYQIDASDEHQTKVRKQQTARLGKMAPNGS